MKPATSQAAPKPVVNAATGKPAISDSVSKKVPSSIKGNTSNSNVKTDVVKQVNPSMKLKANARKSTYSPGKVRPPDDQSATGSDSEVEWKVISEITPSPSPTRSVASSPALSKTNPVVGRGTALDNALRIDRMRKAEEAKTKAEEAKNSNPAATKVDEAKSPVTEMDTSEGGASSDSTPTHRVAAAKKLLPGPNLARKVPGTCARKTMPASSNQTKSAENSKDIATSARKSMPASSNQNQTKSAEQTNKDASQGQKNNSKLGMARKTAPKSSNRRGSVSSAGSDQSEEDDDKTAQVTETSRKDVQNSEQVAVEEELTTSSKSNGPVASKPSKPSQKASARKSAPASSNISKANPEPAQQPPNLTINLPASNETAASNSARVVTSKPAARKSAPASSNSPGNNSSNAAQEQPISASNPSPVATTETNEIDESVSQSARTMPFKPVQSSKHAGNMQMPSARKTAPSSELQTNAKRPEIRMAVQKRTLEDGEFINKTKGLIVFQDGTKEKPKGTMGLKTLNLSVFKSDKLKNILGKVSAKMEAKNLPGDVSPSAADGTIDVNLLQDAKVIDKKENVDLKDNVVAKLVSDDKLNKVISHAPELATFQVCSDKLLGGNAEEQKDEKCKVESKEFKQESKNAVILNVPQIAPKEELKNEIKTDIGAENESEVDAKSVDVKTKYNEIKVESTVKHVSKQSSQESAVKEEGKSQPQTVQIDSRDAKTESVDIKSVTKDKSGDSPAKMVIESSEATSDRTEEMVSKDAADVTGVQQKEAVLPVKEIISFNANMKEEKTPSDKSIDDLQEETKPVKPDPPTNEADKVTETKHISAVETPQEADKETNGMTKETSEPVENFESSKSSSDSPAADTKTDTSNIVKEAQGAAQCLTKDVLDSQSGNGNTTGEESQPTPPTEEISQESSSVAVVDASKQAIANNTPETTKSSCEPPSQMVSGKSADVRQETTLPQPDGSKSTKESTTANADDGNKKSHLLPLVVGVKSAPIPPRSPARSPARKSREGYSSDDAILLNSSTADSTDEPMEVDDSEMEDYLLAEDDVQSKEVKKIALGDKELPMETSKDEGQSSENKSLISEATAPAEKEATEPGASKTATAATSEATTSEKPDTVTPPVPSTNQTASPPDITICQDQEQPEMLSGSSSVEKSTAVVTAVSKTTPSVSGVSNTASPKVVACTVESESIDSGASKNADVQVVEPSKSEAASDVANTAIKSQEDVDKDVAGKSSDNVTLAASSENQDVQPVPIETSVSEGPKDITNVVEQSDLPVSQDVIDGKTHQKIEPKESTPVALPPVSVSSMKPAITSKPVEKTMLDSSKESLSSKPEGNSAKMSPEITLMSTPSVSIAKPPNDANESPQSSAIIGKTNQDSSTTSGNIKTTVSALAVQSSITGASSSGSRTETLPRQASEEQAKSSISGTSDLSNTSQNGTPDLLKISGSRPETSRTGTPGLSKTSGSATPDQSKTSTNSGTPDFPKPCPTPDQADISTSATPDLTKTSRSATPDQSKTSSRSATPSAGDSAGESGVFIIELSSDEDSQVSSTLVKPKIKKKKIKAKSTSDQGDGGKPGKRSASPLLADGNKKAKMDKAAEEVLSPNLSKQVIINVV